jgi:hypothetical protein
VCISTVIEVKNKKKKKGTQNKNKNEKQQTTKTIRLMQKKKIEKKGAKNNKRKII